MQHPPGRGDGRAAGPRLPAASVLQRGQHRGARADHRAGDLVAAAAGVRGARRVRRRRRHRRHDHGRRALSALQAARLPPASRRAGALRRALGRAGRQAPHPGRLRRVHPGDRRPRLPRRAAAGRGRRRDHHGPEAGHRARPGGGHLVGRQPPRGGARPGAARPRRGGRHGLRRRQQEVPEHRPAARGAGRGWLHLTARRAAQLPVDPPLVSHVLRPGVVRDDRRPRASSPTTSLCRRARAAGAARGAAGGA